MTGSRQPTKTAVILWLHRHKGYSSTDARRFVDWLVCKYSMLDIARAFYLQHNCHPSASTTSLGSVKRTCDKFYETGNPSVRHYQNVDGTCCQKLREAYPSLARFDWDEEYRYWVRIGQRTFEELGREAEGLARLEEELARRNAAHKRGSS